MLIKSFEIESKLEIRHSKFMDSCLFCKIITGQIQAYKIYEDDNAVAILDVHPRAPGHTMVLSKTHAENILDLPNSDVGPVFTAVKKVAKKLKDVLNCDGLTIGINHGRVSGQLVDHLHIHVIPRWQDDGGKSIHSVVDNPSKETLEETYKKLKI